MSSKSNALSISSANSSERRAQFTDKQAVANLSVIAEKTKIYGEKIAKKFNPSQIDDEILKKFKQHMLNKEFFAKLKEIMFDINNELRMTRNGGMVTDEYIAIHKDNGTQCEDQIRSMVTHDNDFKAYIKENRMRMRNVVNNASNFEDGAPTGITYLKMKKLNGEAKSINKIKKTTRQINSSQEKAIVKAFNCFKNVKDSVFYEKNLDSNPSIYRAVINDRRKKREEDLDIY